jgi:hypothetical protein
MGRQCHGIGDDACGVTGITDLGSGKVEECMEGSTRVRNDDVGSTASRAW